MSPEAPKAKSFADILQQNQEFISHLQALQQDIGGQLDEKEKELALIKRQLAEKLQELDELQNAQLQWAMDRQGLLDQHEALKQGHQDLQQKHDQAQVELGRLKDDLAHGRARDEERRAPMWRGSSRPPRAPRRSSRRIASCSRASWMRPARRRRT